jgi:hypothetical protein
MDRMDRANKIKKIKTKYTAAALSVFLLLIILLSSCAAGYKPSLDIFTRANGKPFVSIGNLGLKPIFSAFGSPIIRLTSKYDLIIAEKDNWTKNGGDATALQRKMAEMSGFADAAKFKDAIDVADEILYMMEVPSEKINASYIGFHRKERDGLISDIKKIGANGLEDYVGWIAVEPVEGVYNWEVYREDAQAIRKAGLSYIAFLWIQTIPEWAKKDPKYVLASNVATGKETQMLSIFAPSTLDAYDRFYGEASRQMGSMIDILRIGTPYDYGETAYPASSAVSAVFPVTNSEPGLWVNEAPARENFKNTMKSKYGNIQKLNAVWGTSFASFDLIDYPSDNTKARYWLDFITWYHEGLTVQTGKIADIARKYFPKTPINLNIGWPYEKISLGQDLSGLMKMGSEKQLCMRSPTGPGVPFLYTKRVATAARWYPPARLSSEPIDGNATIEQSVQSYFKDLTTGINWHFDYAPNCLRADALFTDYLNSGQAGQYPIIDTALFYPNTTQYLENWNNWQGNGDTGGNPAGLAEYAEYLRDAIDYDVVDERIVRDGFLKEYKYLLWPVGITVEADTLKAIVKWVQDGGFLLVSGIDKIRTVEGDSGALGDITKTAAVDGVRSFGKGSVIDISNNPAEILAKYPGFADTFDGVLMSRYENGILVFNRTANSAAKTIDTGSRTIDVTLAPSQIMWIPK